tara:strand:- start:1675 stop:1791 length:117 start_codon:yes stop_codon:yes gene_type:complete
MLLNLRKSALGTAEKAIGKSRKGDNLSNNSTALSVSED